MARFGYHRPPGPREDEMANREGFGRDQEEPAPTYPQQRRQAVREAQEELAPPPEEELAAAHSPEDFSTYPPLETVPAERFSTEQEAASEALEDQQQQRLQKSIVDKVKSQGIRAVESIGIPLGMAMQPQQTVDMAPDPITGRQTAREAGTLANQELAQNRRWLNDYMAEGFEQKPGQPYAIRGIDREKMPVPDPFRKMARNVPGKPITHDPFYPVFESPTGLYGADKHPAYTKGQKAGGKWAARGAPWADKNRWSHWIYAAAAAMDRSQELKNLSASASDLMTGVSKAAGGISKGMALLGVITAGGMVGYEVLKELGDADDTAIPKTLRFIAQNQEAPLYDYHVAPEAAAQLTPQDIEELYQDGTLSYEFYTQLKGR